MIDILSNSSDPRAARLSNFTRRSFIFRSIKCASLEGFLQSLKSHSVIEQKRICLLSGKEAKEAGQELNNYWDSAWVYWGEDAYCRYVIDFFLLISTAYNNAYEQDPTFKDDLLATGHNELRHTIGKHDPRETILTEAEYLLQMYRLRARAHEESR